MEITKQEFEAYEEVRAGGLTNMFDVPVVEMISGLDRDKIIAIMKQYGQLEKQYPDVRRRMDGN